MSTRPRIRPIINSRLFPPSLDSSEHAPRRKPLDPMVRRYIARNQMSNEPKSYEAQEFLSPEYLDQQRRLLMYDISNIQKEMLPLKQQYEKLKQAEEPATPSTTPHHNSSPRSPRSPRDEYSFDSPRYNENKRIDFAQMVKKSQIEYEEACSQIAQLRRIYCEANKLRLEDQIQEYQEQIEELTQSLDTSNYKLEKVISQLDAITSSEETSRIIEQQDKIHALREELDKLLDIEDEYIKRNDDLLDEQPQITTLANKAESLKRKLSSYEYNNSAKRVELIKRQKQFDYRIIELQNLLKQAKRKQKQKKVKKIFLYGVTAKYETPITEEPYQEEEEEQYEPADDSQERNITVTEPEEVNNEPEHVETNQEPEHVEAPKEPEHIQPKEETVNKHPEEEIEYEYEYYTDDEEEDGH